MWHDMVSIEIPAWGKVIRTIVVYAGLAILLRLAGKRDLAQLNTFDLVVVLLLANVLQNAVIGDDYSLVGGLLGAAVLISVNAAWVRIAASSNALSRWTEGRPTMLVRDGQIVAKPSRSGLRHADILVALRRQGAHSLEDVERATLTPRGSIIVDLRPEARTATAQDLHLADDAVVARLQQRLDDGLGGIHGRIDELAAALGEQRG